MLVVSPLTPDRLPDWLAFFDRDAFADNPEWAGCYCRCYAAPDGFDDTKAAENRAGTCAAIQTGRFHGYLAQDGEKVVGWCQAGPTAEVPRITAMVGRPPDPASAAITCFVVAAPWRGRGIARALLDGAVAELGARGFTAVDAFPPKAPINAASLYPGPRKLYEDAGFVQVGELDKRWIMRRALG
jgi:GNAT superfamily N-acetyltransferase